MTTEDRTIGIADFNEHLFGDIKVRIAYLSGVSWMILADVCKALGLKNPAVVAKQLLPEERGLSFTYTNRGDRPAIVVNEAGVYRLIMRSNKPSAKEFQKWVFHSVLPMIRQQGSYHVTAEKPAAQGRLTAEGIHAYSMKTVERWAEDDDHSLAYRLRGIESLYMAEVARLRLATDRSREANPVVPDLKKAPAPSPIEIIPTCRALIVARCYKAGRSFVPLPEFLGPYLATFEDDTSTLVDLLQTLISEWAISSGKYNDSFSYYQSGGWSQRLLSVKAALDWFGTDGSMFLQLCEVNYASLRSEQPNLRVGAT